MDIRARSVTGVAYPLSVSGEVSVASLTQDISLLTGLPPDQLQLFSCSALLRDHTPLHLSTGDEIQFLSKIRSGTLIYVKTYTGKTITLEVDLQFDSVEFVKCRIEERYGMSKDEMILVFENQELKNDEKLCSYNIMREATLHLVASKGNLKKQTSQVVPDPNKRRTFGCCVII